LLSCLSVATHSRGRLTKLIHLCDTHIADRTRYPAKAVFGGRKVFDEALNARCCSERPEQRQNLIFETAKLRCGGFPDLANLLQTLSRLGLMLFESFL
jgi:hypothetical protein